ncbi:MAG TPA: hypothetical protein VFA57_03145 [Pseudolabrys sp.]|jgi:hypothetical protein|nr:hypothetical protein [Pseudolabrys sp.]
MTSLISSATSNSDYYATLFAGGGTNGAGTTAGWLNDAVTAIQNSQNSGGILGALENIGDGSIGSFLGQSSLSANNFALISQNSVTNATQFYTQIAAQNQQAQQEQALEKAATELQQQQSMVQPTNLLPPVVFLPDGTTIDTTSNIMTRPDGTQYDVTTGARYVDPSDIIQMANGSYLNTQTNILTLSDGTQIDTVTGLKVSTTA